MNISVEISMYPLHQDYIPPITEFIKALRTNPTIKVRTNGMSTQLFGEFEEVTKTLTAAIKTQMEKNSPVTFITKFLNKDVSNYEPDF